MKHINYYLISVLLSVFLMGCTTTLIKETTPSATKADLTATAYGLTRDNNEKWITVKISNIGGTDVSPTVNGVIDIFIDDMDTPHITYTFLGLFDRDFLASGGHSAIWIQNFSELSTGNHTVLIHVDTTNLVDEADETNNSVTRNIIVN